MEKVVSGIRPTGFLHLGNYFGAVKSFVEMQDKYDSMFFIADWHSLTTRPKPEDIQNSARIILAEYLACGIDPEKAPIYIQSDVKETLELYLYLNMNTYIGELGRVTTFKEKARQQPDNVNAGLFTYPTLMAADILQHRALKVPVGKDQEQNMEMARKCARRFNNIYGVEFFPDKLKFTIGGKDEPLSSEMLTVGLYHDENGNIDTAPTVTAMLPIMLSDYKWVIRSKLMLPDEWNYSVDTQESILKVIYPPMPGPEWVGQKWGERSTQIISGVLVAYWLECIHK